MRMGRRGVATSREPSPAALTLLGRNGSIIDLSGSGAALWSDDLESGNFSHSENGVSWGGRTNNVVMSTERAFTGTHSVLMPFGPDADGVDSSAELDILLGGNYPEVFFKYRMWVPANYFHRTQTDSNNNKGFLYLWNGAYSGGSGPGMGPNFFTGNGGPGAEAGLGESRQKCYIFNGGGFDKYYEDTGQQAMAIEDEDKGMWLEILTHAKYATAANNNGIYRNWKRRWDGSAWGAWIQMLNLQSMDSYVAGAPGFDHLRILGYANSGFAEETKFFVDDPIFSTTNIFGVT